MSDSTETTPPDADGAAPKKGIMGLLLPVGGAVAGIAIGAAVGLFVIGPRMAPASAAPSAAAPSKSEHGEEGHGGEKGDHKEGKEGEAKPMYQIDNLVLNPAGSGGARFLLVSVALEAKDEAALAQLKAHDAELRDVILRMFGSKTVDQVSEASSRDALRVELIGLIQKTVPNGAVQKLYFPQFVIQ